MAIVIGREHDHSAEGLIRRFKRACDKENILSDIRKHEFYNKPKWKRRQARLSARKRHLKKLAKENDTRSRGR